MKRAAAVGIFAVILCLHGPGMASAADLQLADGGSTSYRIVAPENPTPVDRYAVDTLARYLQQITGAAFPAVEPGEVGDRQKCIFVGMSAPARSVLGEDPLADLEDEEHVARSIDGDIFLYGEGIHGNLYAVMQFLESSLGWRWYSVHEEPVLPSQPTLTLRPFNRRRGFTFGYREVQLNFGTDFYYQHGINLGYARRDRTDGGRYRSRLPTTKFVHTSFAYIPPAPESRYADGFEWQDRKNYFETNPDFFSMNEAGQRVPNRQLCFSNPALRQELTRNVFRDIEHAQPTANQGLIVTIDAADTPGSFCHCPGCQALERQYHSPGGPIFDYLIELCGQLKLRHPNVMVRTLAYRRSQTQHPIVLPEGETLPDNLIVAFAPIEDNYFADWWNHRDADIQETYADLRGWSDIAHHLWAWMYPNPWGSGAVMPVGNIERIINNMRLMAYAGVEGVFTDHHGINERSGFYELQSYLILKLMQDVDCDTQAAITQFTDHHYGPAGPLMRTYISELEEGRKRMELPPGVRYKSQSYDEKTFPYLTADNIHRWQTYFDRMEELTAETPEKRLNVRKERRELDFATLWKWQDLAERYPEYFQHYQVHAQRIRDVNAALREEFQVRPLGEDALEEFVLRIRAAGRHAPLPPQLRDIDRSRVRQLVPLRHHGGPRIVADADAAFGYAAPVHMPDMPFNFGFYAGDEAPRDRQELPELPPDSLLSWHRTMSGTYSLRRELEADEIAPGEYYLYEMGDIEVTPDCLIWFSNQSWATNLQLGSRLYEAGGDNRWHVWVSMKFDGPTYGGTMEEDR
ncbi:MAG: DUF4838 domain-containing protein, partial [Armatimonadota bacterium]